MKGKNYIYNVVLGLLSLAFSMPASAINNSSPQIHCISVDSVGDVTLTWNIPGNMNAATFVNYTIYSSASQAGPYVASATVPTIGQSSVTINGIGANIKSIYFYIQTNTTTGPSPVVDTLRSIYLNVFNGGGRAILLWNAIATPNLPSSTGWYKIYREYPQYVWTLIDSTQSLSYIDTITICSANLNYKVEIDDQSGCTSSSNWNGGAFSNSIPPPAAIMDTVSVTATNGLYISWKRSTKNDVMAYVVYEFKTGWKAIDTAWGINTLSFFDPNLNPDSASIPICVAAFDSCRHIGALSIQQNSMFLTEAPDTCLQENLLSWTPYTGLLHGVLQYKVWVSLNGHPYTLLGTVGSNTTTYLQTGLNHVAGYHYFVQAIENGVPVETASSNVIFDTVKIPPIPNFSYLRTATVTGANSVFVDCYVDNSAHCTDYTLLRANTPSGLYKQVATATSGTTYVSFTDGSADPNNQSYTYIVTTQNQCGVTVDTTQIGQTIYLTALGSDQGTSTLTWNDFRSWAMGDSVYNIYRSEDNGPFSQVAAVRATGAGTNVYVDNISTILTGQGVFSYYIQAIEKHSWYPFIDTSFSNIAEAYQDPRIYIPTAFSPKGKNKIFIPVGVFVDVTGYDFQIFNRIGQLVFETQDPNQGWDGGYGGSVCMEGVYVYRLVYTSSKGEYFERKGTVTLIK